MKKRILAMVLSALMLLSICACGKKEDKTQGGDNQAFNALPLEGIVSLMIEKSGAEFGAFYSTSTADNSGVAAALGCDSFEEKMKEAVVYGPSIGSVAFSMVLVRTENEADAAGVAKAMKEKANLNKWICVQADFSDTAVRGNVALFLMAQADACDENTHQALFKAFAELDPADYKADDQTQNGGNNPAALLENGTAADVVSAVAGSCAFLENYSAMAETLDGMNLETHRLGTLQMSDLNDGAVIDSLDGDNPFLVGILKLSDGVNVQNYMAELQTVLRSVLPDGTVLILYQGQNIGFCAAKESADAFAVDGVLMTEYFMEEYAGN